jgi:adenosylcobinamide-GDP ribazoletransferase
MADGTPSVPDGRPSVLDGLRLAYGTLTAVRVGYPSRVDPATFGAAMVLAPATTVPALACWVVLGLLVSWGVLTVWVAAVLALAATALLSRALHLDGLADLADGLTSGHEPGRSLEVMRRGDTGPAGAAALVIVLVLQTACLAALFVHSAGVALGAVALVASRLAPALCARDGIPAARADGLGHGVAGTVSRRAAFALVVVVGLVAGAACWLAVPAASPGARLRLAVGGVVVLLAGVAGALVVRRRALSRLGGVTGDVIGAAIEIALAVALVVATLADNAL